MDTITLQEALAGFTANESAALGSYIGLSSGGAGQKQSIAALAKVAGGLPTSPRLTDSIDLNDIKTQGVYYWISSNAPANKPNTATSVMIVLESYGSAEICQIVISISNPIKSRMYHNNAWYDWS